jgi:hypothetical protein
MIYQPPSNRLEAAFICPGFCRPLQFKVNIQFEEANIEPVTKALFPIFDRIT